MANRVDPDELSIFVCRAERVKQYLAIAADNASKIHKGINTKVPKIIVNQDSRQDNTN